MKDRQISDIDKSSFCDRNESHFYDNKAIQISGKKIQKIACAFANADGGEFVVGIKDKKEETDVLKRWQSITDQEQYNFVLQNIYQLDPTIPHNVEFLKDDKGTFALRVIIEKSQSVHKTTDNTVYIRKGAQSIPIKDPKKIRELSYSKGESSYEDSIIKDAEPEDIFESLQIRSFLNDYSPKSDPIDFTVSQNLVDRKTYEPRTAGILLFSNNPTPLIPTRCGIKITRYDTSEEIPEREHLKTQLTIEGALYEQIQKASSEITKIMESVQVMTANGLNKANYPPETIWEILVNAVIHRDYSISDDIHVLIFNNRIEIKSPGKLPGYVTVENILDSRFSRNSKIVRILNKYKNPPNKDMGEGLNTAFQKMEEFRLKKPIITEEGNYINVTIAHTPLASPEETIIEYLKKNPKIRNREARAITGVKSENVMKRHFYKLRKANEIEPVMSANGNKIVAWKLKEK